VDLRLTQEDITGEQFVKLLETWRAKHPETKKSESTAFCVRIKNRVAGS
jgi:hypothetical protein